MVTKLFHLLYEKKYYEKIPYERITPKVPCTVLRYIKYYGRD